MILYIKKCEKLYQKKKRSDLLKGFSKVAGYKVYIKNSIAFLCTNNIEK